jgi:hypothetical protein
MTPKIAIGLLSLAAAAQAAGAGDFSWQRDAGSVALLKGSQVIWQFRYGKDEAKPSFHPVSVPGGPVITCYRNEDHPWHRGMWFSWKFVNGVNYWEEDKSGVSEGLTETRNVKVDTRRDFSARMSMEITYRPAKGEPVMTEKRTIQVSPPDAQGVYHLDWTMTFQALDKDVFLDRTPIPGDPDGKAHGGYSGLAVRFAREITDIQVSTTNGPMSFPETGYRGFRTKATAADYSGSIDNRVVGIAFVDHPKNLNAPSPWWVIDLKAMKYFNPSVLCYAPYTLKAGKSMTLRYRAMAHPGRWDRARLRAEAERYGKAQ